MKNKNGMLTGDYDKLLRKLQEKQGIKQNLNNITKNNVKKIRRLAKQNAPVDTGELRRSIGYSVEDNGYSVGATAKHGLPVELGTSRQDAQPFLYPAVNQYKQEFINEIFNEVKR